MVVAADITTKMKKKRKLIEKPRKKKKISRWIRKFKQKNNDKNVLDTQV